MGRNTLLWAVERHKPGTLEGMNDRGHNVYIPPTVLHMEMALTRTLPMVSSECRN